MKSALADRHIQARNYRDRSTSVPENGRIWIVIHDMEAAEGMNTAENVGNYFATTTRKASTHYGNDVNSCVSYVDERHACYGAWGANDLGIHIEQAGYAKQSAAEWRDPYSETMIDSVARLCADISRRHGMPLVHVGIAGVRAKTPGIVTHDDMSKGTGRGTHWDPGPHYPMAFLVERANLYKNRPGKVRPILHRGMSDGQRSLGFAIPKPIEHAQEIMVARGFDLRGGPDGIFGPGTQSTVRAFQGEHGIDETGHIGAATWAMLMATPEPTPEPAPEPEPTPEPEPEPTDTSADREALELIHSIAAEALS